MKKRILAVTAIALLLCAALGFTYQQTTTWDYKVVTMSADGGDKYDTDLLNASGLSGWELVSTERNGRSRTYFFKRPK